MDDTMYNQAMAFIKDVVLSDGETSRNIKENGLNILLKEAENVFKIQKGLTIACSDHDIISGFLRDGQKIQAIKHIRAVKGLDLRLAKDLADRWFTLKGNGE